MVYETERLILRYFTLEDTWDVYQYSKNPKVAVQAVWIPHPNVEYSKRIVEKFIQNKEIAIVLKQSQKVVGSIGIFSPADHTLTGKEISYALAEEIWGQGIMKEALNYAIPYIFEQYRCDEIYCCNFLDNVRSRGVAEGLGFTYFKDFLYTDIPNGNPKMVRYYQLRYKDFYYFKYDFTKEQYQNFRNLVQWNPLEENQFNYILENSTYRLTIYNQGELLGMARCISDKAYLYLLCDIMIHPEFQKKGIGKRLVSHFIQYLKHKIGNQYAKIYIMSLKGKEGFYKSLGFQEDIATGLTIVCEGDNHGNERKEN